MTTIKHSQSISPKDNIVLLAHEKSDFSSYGLSQAELSFLKAEIKKEEHFISINQYSRRVMVYIEEKKKEAHLVKEAFRRAGNRACAVLNAAKAPNVTIVDIIGNGEHTLAFAEGMALGNYQFLEYRQKDLKKLEHALKTIHVNSKKVVRCKRTI